MLSDVCKPFENRLGVLGWENQQQKALRLACKKSKTDTNKQLRIPVMFHRKYQKGNWTKPRLRYPTYICQHIFQHLG